MRPAPRTFALPGGETCVVRPAVPGEAGAILDHVLAVHHEDPDAALADPAELRLGVDGLASLVRTLAGSPRGLFLVAWAAERVVGTLSLEPSRHRKSAHVAELGMSVRKGWRRHGIGRLLARTAIDAARAAPELRRISLRVFATNDAALALYHALGFEIEGRQRGEIFAGGRHIDLVWMALGVGDAAG